MSATARRLLEDPSFVYRPAIATDIRARFERVRAELMEAANGNDSLPPAADVVPAVELDQEQVNS